VALRLIDIGVLEAHAAKLSELGITTAEALLKEAGLPEGRERLANVSGIAPAVILKWVNYADLTRIKGIGVQYAELLEAAGIENVRALRNLQPAQLLARLANVNAQLKLTRHLPTAAKIATWIEEAKVRPVRVS
jgi:predicted flap endonuclease-1-like 5' DNA nuclease